jgi:predicted MFS family arabinose efflux permease
MIGVFFFLTQVMQDALGFSPLQAGLAFLTMTVPLFAAARTAPRLLARFGPKPVTAAGTALITASMAWLTQLSGVSSFAVGLLGPRRPQGDDRSDRAMGARGRRRARASPCPGGAGP